MKVNVCIMFAPGSGPTGAASIILEAENESDHHSLSLLCNGRRGARVLRGADIGFSRSWSDERRQKEARKVWVELDAEDGRSLPASDQGR